MQVNKRIQFTLILCSLLIVIEVINMLTGRSLSQFGVIPRQIDSLPMILISPFIHANWGHLIANLTTLLVFLLLLGTQSQRRFLAITLWIIVFTGVSVWLFGRPASHIGASGVIYGYFGFLLLAGFRTKQLTQIAISIGVAVIYGSLVFGVLPQGGFVSWESHLFGFVSGLIAAWHWAK